MGSTLMQTIETADDLQLAGVWVRSEERAKELAAASGAVITTDIDAVVVASRVLIDFSLPEAFATVIGSVTRHNKPLVCGVSGLDESQMALLELAARDTAIVFDRNMSLGITILDSLVRQAAASLGLDFDVLIEETHHIHKVDAPSGTALKLGEAVAAARGQDFKEVAEFEPAGAVGKSMPGAIRIRAERRGEVPGDHAVTMSSAAETLMLSHSVTTRQVFADGALRAARWVVSQPPGRYSMRDVMF
jgi:4-hydroxy-tetrahydrodipicolinate reductase